MSDLEIIRSIIMKNVREELIGLTAIEKVLIIDALKNDLFNYRKQFEEEVLNLKS